MRESSTDLAKIDMEMYPNALGLLAIVPTSETCSKGISHVKRAINSFVLISSRQHLLGKNCESGNDASAGVTSKGKKKWGLIWAYFCKFGHLMTNSSAHGVLNVYSDLITVIAYAIALATVLNGK